MNTILEPFKSLWKRKLWPVAVLLVGALVAVPMVLAKEPTPPPAPPANATAKADEGMPATFVAAADPAEEGDRRRVLGAAKDPFAPAELSKKAKAARKKAAAEKKAAESKASSSEKSSAGSEKPSKSPSSGGGGDTTPSGPPAGAPPAPTVTVPKYSIKVRFGSTEGEEEPAAKTVERLAVLPDDEQPVVVYRGVEDGGKVAVFELTGTVVAVGDGKCEPNPDNCQILKLRAGETEFLTISDTGEETDAQYQLSLVKINQKQTTEKAESEALTKSPGAKLLGKLDHKRRYVFNPKTGTLHKLRK
jgi:hypothetical protein